MDREEYLMSLLGFTSREQLIEFLNRPDIPSANMAPPGQTQHEMEALVEGKEEIHRLFESLDDLVQRDIETGVADRILAQERVTLHRETDGSKAVQVIHSSELDAVYKATEGLAEHASMLRFGQVRNSEDLFNIEEEILRSSQTLRTKEMDRFVNRMAFVRASAVDCVRREWREAIAATFRFDAGNNIAEQSLQSKQTVETRKIPEVSLGQVGTPFADSAELDVADSRFEACSGAEQNTCRESHAENPFQESEIEGGGDGQRINPLSNGLGTEAVSPENTRPSPDRDSLRRFWPFLTGGAILGALYFSPFNAVPAVVLAIVACTVGFRVLRKQKSLIFLKPALIFLILFVATGMIHDEFFDHPTALCSDGTYSYSHHPAGTCSWHSGVARWHPRRKHWWQRGSEYSSSGTIPFRRSRRVPVSPLQ